MEQSFFTLIIQSIGGLAAVLGLFALMVWGMRRFQSRAGSTAHDFRVIGRIHIDNRSSIVEIRHRGRHYLLAVSTGGVCQLEPGQALPPQGDAATSATDQP